MAFDTNMTRVEWIMGAKFRIEFVHLGTALETIGYKEIAYAIDRHEFLQTLAEVMGKEEMVEMLQQIGVVPKGE